MRRHLRALLCFGLGALLYSLCAQLAAVPVPPCAADPLASQPPASSQRTLPAASPQALHPHEVPLPPPATLRPGDIAIVTLLQLATEDEEPNDIIMPGTNFPRREAFLKMGATSIRNKVQYAHMHSHPFYFFHTKDFAGWLQQPASSTSPKRPPSWLKIPAVLSVLPHYKWVLWIDIDAIFTDMKKPLSRALHDCVSSAGQPPQPPRKHAQQQQDEDAFPELVPPAVHEVRDLVVAYDWNGLNNGVFFIRNCDWSRDFLLQAWHNFTAFQNATTWEQEAMYRIAEEPQNLGHVARVPSRCLNSYPIPTADAAVSGAARDAAHGRGDFVVHAAGHEMSSKLKHLDMYDDAQWYHHSQSFFAQQAWTVGVCKVNRTLDLSALERGELTF